MQNEKGYSSEIRRCHRHLRLRRSLAYQVHPSGVQGRHLRDGEVWHIKSTRPEYKVGICAKCHPFFTGKQKFVDTAGRIDKFNRRYKKQA